MTLWQSKRKYVVPVAAWLAAAAWWVASGERTAADDLVPPSLSAVVRIEEDWELIVGDPAIDRAAPQVSTQMARSTSASRFCNFHLNSLDIPNYKQGGLQLQVWHGQDSIGVTNGVSSDVLNTSGERLTWTQYLSRDSGVLKFGISAAASQTWGDFSGLEVTVRGGSAALDNYDATYSKNNSGVTFGANRVNSMTLLGVRKYHADGSLETDDTVRAVYPADPYVTPPLGGGTTGN